MFTNQWVLLPAGMDMEMEDESESLSPKQVKALEKAFGDFSLFSEADDVGSEEMHGVKVSKYKVVFDKNGILDFVQEVSEILDEEFTAEGREELAEKIDELNAGETHLWIGDKDGLLHKIESKPRLTDESGEEQNVKLELELYDFGESVEVEAPTGAQSFEELMGSMMGSMFGDTMMWDEIMGDMKDLDYDAVEGGEGGMGDFFSQYEDGDQVDMEELQKIMEQYGQPR